jgi:hypothetical protein
MLIYNTIANIQAEKIRDHAWSIQPAVPWLAKKSFSGGNDSDNLN